MMYPVSQTKDVARLLICTDKGAEEVIAGAAVSQATFNETDIMPCNKLTEAPVEMTPPPQCRIRETSSSWACESMLSY